MTSILAQCAGSWPRFFFIWGVNVVGQIPRLGRKAKYVVDAMEILRDLGATVSIKTNKHAKVRVEYGGKSFIWVTGMTPSDRYAQNNAFGQLRRLLREIGIDPPDFHFRSAPTSTKLVELFELIDEAEAEEKNAPTD